MSFAESVRANLGTETFEIGSEIREEWKALVQNFDAVKSERDLNPIIATPAK
jgi:hypothetical protein